MGFNYFEHIDYLMLEANSSCNLECSYCNRKDLEKAGLREDKNLTQEELIQILEKLKRTRINMIKFEGLSEPMLHPKFDELAGILKDHFPKAFVIIATNLQYNLEKTPFVRTLPYVDMVYLSIDGTGKIYEQARAGAKYDRLLKSLDNIERLIPQSVRQEKLHINFTLSPENFRTLPEVYGLKEKYALASVRINLAQNWSQSQVNQLSFSEEVIKFLEPYRKDVKGVSGWDYRDCFWPFNGMIIDVFGDVRQCVINTDMKPIANIFRDDIEEIYNTSKHFTRAREQLNQNVAPTQCETCDYKHLSSVLRRILGESGARPRAKAAPR